MNDASARSTGESNGPGPRVLITGAAGAFGRAVSRALRERHARVLGLDLHAEAELLACDLRDTAQVEEAVGEAVRRLGGLDVLVNNAGIGGSTDAGALPDDHAMAMVDVNLLGTWRVTAVALPALLASHGRVVNISSGLAFVSLPHTAAYCATKRAIVAYGEVLQAEYPERLEVTTVFPGYVPTPIHDSDPDAPSLRGVVREEAMEDVVATICRACLEPHKRELATSRRTGLELELARHAPSVVRWLLRRRAGTG